MKDARNLHKAKQSAIMIYMEETKEYFPIAYCINRETAKQMVIRLNVGSEVLGDIESAVERVMTNKQENHND